jgi:hypothetical protein
LKNKAQNLFSNAYEKIRAENPNIERNETEKDISFKTQLFKKQKVFGQYNEIENYLKSQIENESTNPIEWWFKNSENYPNLSKIAFDYLIIPASSVPSEQIFSKAGNLITKLRNLLDKSTVRDLMLLNSWNNIQ